MMTLFGYSNFGLQEHRYECETIEEAVQTAFAWNESGDVTAVSITDGERVIDETQLAELIRRLKKDTTNAV